MDSDFSVDASAFVGGLARAFDRVDDMTVKELDRIGNAAVNAAKSLVHSSTISPTIRSKPGRDAGGPFVEVQAGFQGGRSFIAHLREFGTSHSGAVPFLRPALERTVPSFGRGIRL